MNQETTPAVACPVDRRVSRQDLERLREIALAATQGPWLWGATPCPDKAKAVAICEDNIVATKEPIDHFYEVYVEDGRRIALFGNGPTSHENSEYLVTFDPPNVLLLLDLLESLLPANVELMGCPPHETKKE